MAGGSGAYPGGLVLPSEEPGASTHWGVDSTHYPFGVGRITPMTPPKRLPPEYHPNGTSESYVPLALAARISHIEATIRLPSS